ncbi:MAG TPA: TetR/AcrR family transcriptional regulator, partial [Labilithrix sp.]|nr:TetR/AcrR family transcriptional regulator [Labilithrix sp.]
MFSERVHPVDFEIFPAVSRQETKAATRARILEAAKAQLESLGFEQTNIRGVAKAAGVAAGTVLLHFPDKRDLLHTAVFEDLARTWAEAKAASGDGTLRQELSAVVKAFFDYYARRPALSRALLRESLFAEPPWNARFAGQIGDVHRHVVSLVQKAQARGELDEKIDADVLGASFFSFYYFALLAWLQGGHEAPLRLFERMLDQHLGTAKPKPSRPRSSERKKQKGTTR